MVMTEKKETQTNTYSVKHLNHFILYLNKINLLPTEYILLNDLAEKDGELFKIIFNQHEIKQYVIDLNVINVAMIKNLVRKGLLVKPDEFLITKINDSVLSTIYKSFELTELGVDIVKGLYEKENRIEVLKTYDEVQVNNTIEEKNDIEDWLPEWLELFHPSEINITGKDSSVEKCLQPMIKLCKEKDYNKDLIFKATRLYIQDSLVTKELNPKYLMSANNFIDYNGKSKLIKYCKYVIAGWDITNNINTTAL